MKNSYSKWARLKNFDPSLFPSTRKIFMVGIFRKFWHGLFAQGTSYQSLTPLKVRHLSVPLTGKVGRRPFCYFRWFCRRTNCTVSPHRAGTLWPGRCSSRRSGRQHYQHWGQQHPPDSLKSVKDLAFDRWSCVPSLSDFGNAVVSDSLVIKPNPIRPLSLMQMNPRTIFMHLLIIGIIPELKKMNTKEGQIWWNTGLMDWSDTINRSSPWFSI